MFLLKNKKDAGEYSTYLYILYSTKYKLFECLKCVFYIRNNKISMFLTYSSTPGAWQLKQLRGWVPPRHHSFTSERRTLLFVSSLNKSGKMGSLLSCLGLTVRWPTSSGALSLYILSPSRNAYISIRFVFRSDCEMTYF